METGCTIFRRASILSYLWFSVLGFALAFAMGCSEQPQPEEKEDGDVEYYDGEEGEDPNGIPGVDALYKKVTQLVHCKDHTFRLEFRGSILFIFNQSDSIVSIIDIGDKKDNGLWNRIRSLFNLSRVEAIESADVINWTGCDGLAPRYDKADIRTGNKIGRAIVKSVAPIQSFFNHFVPEDARSSLHSLKGTRQLNEAIRRVANIIPVLGFFINKGFAMEDEANLVSIGKAIKQIELLLLENEELMRFLNTRGENADQARNFLTKSLKDLLLESATPTPLGDLIMRVMQTSNHHNAGVLGDVFYRELDRERGRVQASNIGNSKLFRWLGREGISLLGNIFGLPQYYFLGIFLDGHAGNMDGAIMGYLMEEALLAGDGRVYEKAHSDLRAQAIIPTFGEVVRNVRVAYNAVRQFMCSSYEVFYNRLSPDEKEQLTRAQAAARKIVHQFDRSMGQFHDGILGNISEARIAHGLALSKGNPSPSLFGDGSYWIVAARNSGQALDGLGKAAQGIWDLWQMIENKAPNDAMMREKRKLVFLIQEWALVNGQLHVMIDEIYRIQPDLGKGGLFADGGLSEANKRITSFRAGEGDRQTAFRKLNDLLTSGGDPLMEQLNEIVAAHDIPLRELWKFHGQGQIRSGFSFRTFHVDRESRQLKSDRLIQSPTLSIQKTWL